MQQDFMVCKMIGEHITAKTKLANFAKHFALGGLALAWLAVAQLGHSSTLLPHILDGDVINCTTPTIGTAVSRDENNCYQSELTQARNSLRDLHRTIYSLASYEERRQLREIEANWNKLRDIQCDIIANNEISVSNRLAINKFCKAVLTQIRIDEVERLNEQILLRTSRPDGKQ